MLMNQLVCFIQLLSGCCRILGRDASFLSTSQHRFWLFVIFLCLVIAIMSFVCIHQELVRIEKTLTNCCLDKTDSFLTTSCDVTQRHQVWDASFLETYLLKLPTGPSRLSQTSISFTNQKTYQIMCCIFEWVSNLHDASDLSDQLIH